MTRLAMFCGLVLIAGSAMAQDKKDIPKELEPFQGTWKVVKAEFEGKEPPDKVPVDLRFTFEGDKLTVKEGKGEAEKGGYTVDPKKSPAEIDLVGPKGMKALGIYKFDKDGKLTLCFEKGKDAARPKAFDTKGTTAGMIVLEKVKE
jgi:uncharacterized protein (TIGR03067 family)